MPCGLHDYEVINTIGSGSYGICKKIRRKRDAKILVWKELDYGSMSEAEKSMLVSEVNLLRELKHKYIVRYYDRIIDRSTTTLYIIMEYCEGGDLATYINTMKKEGCSTPENYVWKICHQIVSALKECHSRSRNGKTILHRDLKPANVFLDNNKDVKLGDFGLARVLNHETSFAKTFVGTPYYMSPEQMNYMSYNEKSDVWSLGCLLYELCVYRPPFTANSQRELATKICNGQFIRLPSRYSDDLGEIISYMLQVDEMKRPTMEKLSEHPVLLKHVPSDQRLSMSSEEDYTQRLELLKRRENHLLDQEALLQGKEKTLKDLEKNLKEKEKQLKERERSLRQKEKDVEGKERSVFVREKEVMDQLTRLKAMKENLHKASPRGLSDGIKYDLLDREPGELLPISISDSGIHSPCPLSTNKTRCARDTSANSRDSHPGDRLVHRFGSASSLDNLLVDFEERKKSAKGLGRKFSAGRSPLSISSPTSKLASPRSENYHYTPKILSGHYRSPLETIGDSNREVTTEISRRGSFSPKGCNPSSGTPQVVLKDRVLKLFKKSPPDMFSKKLGSGIRPLINQDM